MSHNNNNRIGGTMTDKNFIWALGPKDPIMQKLRAEYFNVTGHYGSDDEVKAWYTNEDPKNNPYSTKYKETPSA